MDDINQNKTQALEEQLQNERKKLSSDRMDISFGELINLYKNKELIIRPEYQRLFRWNSQQKTALIESILLSIPIPPIFVAEDQNGIWELVDGLQRVSTFIGFFGELNENVTELVNNNIIKNKNDSEEGFEEDYEEDGKENYALKNKWNLEAGGLLPDLEGFNIDTLPTALKINLKRATCRVEILRGESQTAMKYELFKRLNAGGSKLTPQEIRNAIFRGVNPKLNQLVQELSQNEIFIKLTKLTPKKKQELYDQELVLRFIAFLNNSQNVNKNSEIFLSEFMSKAVNDESFNCEYFRKIFIQVLDLINSIDDSNIFKNNRNTFVPAYFEGITIAIAQNIELYIKNKHLLIEKINTLKIDEKFKNLSGSLSNSKDRIRKRLQRANEIFENIS